MLVFILVIIEKRGAKEIDSKLPSRIKAMDTARGIATWLLMPAHFSHWYLKIIPSPSWMQYLFRSILGTAFQYVFVTLPGMAVTLQLYIGRKRGIDENCNGEIDEDYQAAEEVTCGFGVWEDTTKVASSSSPSVGTTAA